MPIINLGSFSHLRFLATFNSSSESSKRSIPVISLFSKLWRTSLATGSSFNHPTTSSTVHLFTSLMSQSDAICGTHSLKDCVKEGAGGVTTAYCTPCGRIQRTGIVNMSVSSKAFTALLWVTYSGHSTAKNYWSQSTLKRPCLLESHLTPFNSWWCAEALML